MIRVLVTLAAKKIKGEQYQLDPDLPLSSILTVAIQRLAGLVRCVLYRVKFSLNLSELVFVERNVVLRNRSLISLGGGSTLGEGVLIDGLSRQGVRIGTGCNIGPYTRIEATGVISNLGLGCTIGKNCGIGAFSFIGAAGGVSIGDDVIMGQRVGFHSENHLFDDLTQPIRSQGVSREGIKIGSNCWIGAGVIFLDGSSIGDGCVVAAGAVVRGTFPPNAVIGGVPARIIRSREAV